MPDTVPVTVPDLLGGNHATLRFVKSEEVGNGNGAFGNGNGCRPSGLLLELGERALIRL